MEHLLQSLLRVLKEYPGQTGRFYTHLLRTQGFPNISKYEVNSMLYGRSDLFIPNLNDNYVPAWEVSLAPQPLALLETKSKNTKSVPIIEYDKAVEVKKVPFKGISNVKERKKTAVKKEDYIHENLNFEWDPKFELYDWQKRALNQWQIDSYRGIVEAVTGSGKTRMAIAAMDAFLKLGLKVLIIVPYKELMKQWNKEIMNHLSDYKVGFLGDGNKQDLKHVDILIAISNSAQKYKTLPEGFKALIIGDEVHHYGTPNSKKMLEKGYLHRLGITACLEREDTGVEKIIKPYFGEIVYTYEYSEAIQENVIAPFKIVFASVPMSENEKTEYESLSTNISRKKKVLEQKYPELTRNSTESYFSKLSKLPGNDKAVYQYKNLLFTRSQMVMKMPSKLQAINHLSPIIKGSNGTFIFTQLSSMTDEVTNLLKKSGIKVDSMDGKLSQDKRDGILSKFKERLLDAVVAPKLLDEGIDVPAADLAIITGKSRSRRQMIQRIGRVVRRKLDGGFGKIIIIISEGTLDDPNVSNTEAFYDVFTDAEVDINRFSIVDELKELINYLKEWLCGKK